MPSAVTDLDRVKRFICFGSDTGLLVIGDAQPCRENASAIGRLISDGKGEDVMREIVRCHEEKLYVHQTPLIFALAYCYKSTDSKTKQAAGKAFPNVCKMPTDMFYFVEYSKLMSDKHKGWGRSQRTLASKWYNGKDSMTLLDGVTRFKTGCSWSHVDVLRLSHTNPAKYETAVIIKYLMKGFVEAKALVGDKDSPSIEEIMKYLEAVENVKRSTDEHQVARLIEQFNFKKEHIPTDLQHSPEIWSALLNKMPLPDVLKNIMKIAGLGVLDNSHNSLSVFLDKLTEKNIKESGVSPMSVLIALRNYEQGKGKVKWIRNGAVCNALNIAFAMAIKNNVKITKKRCLVAVKVGVGLPQVSVRGTVALSAMIASAGLATIFNQSEDNCSLVFFSSSVTPVPTTKQMDIQQICEAISQVSLPEVPVSACDMSAPIRWAKDAKKPFDVIIILTDSKDSTGTMSPYTAFQQYRKEIKQPNTKLVVCGLTSRKLHFADSNDSGMLDIAGFDATVPDAISTFINEL